MNSSYERTEIIGKLMDKLGHKFTINQIDSQFGFDAASSAEVIIENDIHFSLKMIRGYNFDYDILSTCALQSLLTAISQRKSECDV